MTTATGSPRALLRALFDAAVAAADPALRVAAHLPPPPAGRTIVLGAGKASAVMARAVEEAWSGPLSGLVVTRYGYAQACRHIEIVEAAHPVPDAAGEAAARRILEIAEGCGEGDLVLCLISGGGSALMPLPAPGLTLADKQAMNRALLRSGADIAEINTVRKHLSAIKGGRLAAAIHPACGLALMISDVPGDDPATIASGPTVGDATTFADALAIAEKYAIAEPGAALAHLRQAEEETPKPGDPRLARMENIVIAAAAQSLDAAAERARATGIEAVLLGDDLEGESRELGAAHARLALAAREAGRPTVLLSGGETTVTVRGENGRGGPNTEYLLALALDGAEGIWALACDTDGIDGTEDNAGALLTPDTLTRAAARGLDPRRALVENDAYGVFAALDDLVVTGPTRTNVNDFRAVLISPAA
ncbi:MAG: glycerate kinase [Rhodospirillaceae bacterium]|nr:glycerate kinase [Rhodospirillaceae bacterium]